MAIKRLQSLEVQVNPIPLSKMLASLQIDTALCNDHGTLHINSEPLLELEVYVCRVRTRMKGL